MKALSHRVHSYGGSNAHPKTCVHDVAGVRRYSAGMVRIRRAPINDSERIAAVHVRTWQATYADVLPAGYLAAFDPAEWAARRRRDLTSRRPPTEVFVAEVDGELVGHAAVRPFRTEDGTNDDDVGEVAAIYVAPEHWSTGVGLALLRVAVDHLVGHGLTEIRLWVVADNPRARRFYERFGFTADGTSRPQPVGPGYEDVAPIEHVLYTLRRARRVEENLNHW